MGAEAGPRPRGAGHPRLVAGLLIVATLLTFVGIFSIWVNRQALNTDNWVDTSDQLLQDEQVQAQLSIFVTNELFENVDVEAELQRALPPRLTPLAGPAAGGLEQLTPQIVERAVGSSQFEALWNAANRNAHEALLRILDGGGSRVSTEGGEVTLDLGTLVAQVGERLGVGGNIASKLPPEAGQVTILKSDQLSAAQSAVKLVRRLPVVLSLLVLLLYSLAIYLAGPRRREALRDVGLGFVVAGGIALIARSVAGGYVVDSLTGGAAAHPAAESTWDIATSLLVTVADSAIAFGLLILAGAWLAGPTRVALSARRWASPYIREHRAGSYAAAGVLFLALIAWAPVVAFRKPLGFLLFAILLAVGAELLRRQVVREFPAA